MSTEAFGGISKRKSLTGAPDVTSGTGIHEVDFTVTQTPITNKDWVSTDDGEYMTGGMMGVETN